MKLPAPAAGRPAYRLPAGRQGRQAGHPADLPVKGDLARVVFGAPLWRNLYPSKCGDELPQKRHCRSTDRSPVPLEPRRSGMRRRPHGPDRHICHNAYKKPVFQKAMIKVHQTSRRPSRAFSRVIPSAYSISPPTGIPYAILVILIPKGLRRSVR